MTSAAFSGEMPVFLSIVGLKIPITAFPQVETRFIACHVLQNKFYIR